MDHGNEPTASNAGEPLEPAEPQYLSRRERRLAEQRSQEPAPGAEPEVDAEPVVESEPAPVSTPEPVPGPRSEVAPEPTLDLVPEPAPELDPASDEADARAPEPVDADAAPAPVTSAAAEDAWDTGDAVDVDDADDVELPPSSPASAAGDPGLLIDSSAIAKPERAEWIPLALAVLVPPVGLIAAIVAAVRSRARRGFAIALNKASIAVALVMCVVLAIVVLVVMDRIEEERLFEERVAAAAGFCAQLDEDPAVRESAIVGWPRQGETIPATIEAMESFVERWNQLALSAPTDIADGVGSIADRGQELLDSVQSARQVDDAEQVDIMRDTVRDSGLIPWVDRYC